MITRRGSRQRTPVERHSPEELDQSKAIRTMGEMLSSIAELLADVPQREYLTINDVITGTHPDFRPQRNDRLFIPNYARLRDGVVVFHMTEGFLTSYMHRLFVPDEDLPVYQHQPFNTDVQCLPVYPDDLVGVEAIAGNLEATRQIGIMLGGVAVEATQDFPHTIGRIPFRRQPPQVA